MLLAPLRLRARELSAPAFSSTVTRHDGHSVRLSRLHCHWRPRHPTLQPCCHLTTSGRVLQKDDEWDHLSKLKHEKTRERIAERDFFLSILNASATKRDAKSYLTQFNPQSADSLLHKTQRRISPDDSARSRRSPDASKSWPLHIALIKIRAIQDIDDLVLKGLAQTLSQLVRLGLSSVIVLDCADGEVIFQDTDKLHANWRELFVNQADRLVAALQEIPLIKANRLDSFLAVTPSTTGTTDSDMSDWAVDVQFSDGLLTSLINGYIPVIPSIAYTTQSQHAVAVDSDQVMLALARDFVQIGKEATEPTLKNHAAKEAGLRLHKPRPEVVIDRFIVLDPLGGLPSATRRSHAFINMQQEYQDVRQELLTTMSDTTLSSVENTDAIIRTAPSNLRHVKNLDLLQKALAILPPSSSALLATPYEAATLAEAQETTKPVLGVGTRRPKNPLIFNLLTDKPLVSSSLPVARLASQSGSAASAVPSNPSTFLKVGLPLTMVPDPRHGPWVAPELLKPYIRLNDDHRINFPQLLNLVEDSFNRPLNVEDYMNRIQNKLAGVIIAGDYEGGAILTWELPVGVPDDGSEESRRRMVPYLDKFAVLKRSQGSGGVADVVFSAMVRSCFPHGVCWRSRKNNPVNKWYFERSVGTFKLPGCNWTMFWTTEGLTEDKQRFSDYESVCRKVLPSWAD